MRVHKLPSAVDDDALEVHHTVKFFPSTPPQGRSVSTDDNLGRGMDLALVTLVFLGFGYVLDRWLDTRPVFMIVMVVLALVGQFVRMWYTYDASMRQHERDRVAAAHLHHAGSQEQAA